MSDGLRRLEQRADWVLVEGARAGGLPLSAQYTFADWVQQEQLPVILVVGIKLGCINHAVLTAQAVQAGLMLAGWITNDVTPPGRRHQNTRPRCAVCCRRRCWAKSRICRRPGGRRWGSIWISACWRSGVWLIGNNAGSYDPALAFMAVMQALSR